MSIKKLAALSIGAALIAFVAIGCGSSDDSTTDSTDSGGGALTKAEFVTKANAICTQGNKQLESEFEDFAAGFEKGEEPSKDEQEEFVADTVVPGVSSQIEEISELGFPEGKEGEEAEAIVASAEEDIEEAEEDPSKLGETTSFKETNKLARAYGLTVCGEEG